MPRAKKPAPVEIGMYIGERIVELGYFPDSTDGNLRIRFAKPQKLAVGDKILYYWWDPYRRLPSAFEAVVSEIENETTFIYWMRPQYDLQSWPPRV